jgi:hypothetical protein
MRRPEAVVHARRSIARKNVKQKGDTPSHAHLTLLAWNLFIPNGPDPGWKPDPGGTVYPVRWQIALLCKSWQRYLHLAALTTKKAATTLCSLYGRMRLMVLPYALCPQRRAPLWDKQKRALRLRKLVRHFQALAERGMQVIWQSELAVRRVLTRACATAARLTAKAARKRQTTAQILREHVGSSQEAVAFAEAVNA